MATQGTHTRGTRRSQLAQIAAVRAEIEKTKQRTDPAGQVMVDALAWSLAELERLHRMATVRLPAPPRVPSFLAETIRPRRAA